MREHKRRSKAKQAEESRRRRTASVVKDGIPYRAAAETRISIAYVQYWVGRLLLQIGWRRVGRRRKRGTDSGWVRGDRSPGGPRPSLENRPKRDAAGARIAEPVCPPRRHWGGGGGAVEREGTGEKELRNVLQGTPDELWQIDHVHPDDGMVLLSVTDDRSRKALALEVRCTATADDITEILDAVTERYGCPKEILSDHQSKVERWHRSLRSSAEEYSNAVGEYAVFYDTVRPHWSRGNRVPDAMYYGNG